MDISFSISLEEEQKARLRQLFSCDDSALEAKLRPFAEASFREHLTMLTGSRAFTRASDFQEERLLRIIQVVTSNRVPSEDTVSAYFHLTPSQSRTLIRNTVTRFGYELSKAMEDSLREVLSHATQDGSAFLIQADSYELINALNKILSKQNPNFQKIVPTPGTLMQFSVSNAEMDKLREVLRM